MTEETKVKKEEFSFSFSIEGELASLAHIKLFNGRNEVVYHGFGNITDLKVTRGIYRLRIELNEFVEDREYRIVSDFTDKLASFKTASSIPLEGRENTHEYFSRPTIQWSAEPTLTTDKTHNNSLFLFFRYAHPAKQYRSKKDVPLLYENFSILNEKREVMFNLAAENTRAEMGHSDSDPAEYFACCGFHVSLPAGQYYLHYKGKMKREMPLFVYPNWQTQLFLMFNEEPVFATARITLGKKGFEPNDKEFSVIDGLLQKMHNGIYYLPEDIKEMAAHGKWENPMLGMVACYIYLLSNEKKDDYLMEMIRNNLQTKILCEAESPDMMALRVLSALHKKRREEDDEKELALKENRAPKEIYLDLQEVVFKNPSMVAAGMKAILKYTQLMNDDGVTSELINDVFMRQRPDTVYTSYSPPPVVSVTESHGLMETLKTWIYGSESSRAEKENDWISAALADIMANDEKGEKEIGDLAESLRLSPKTVEKYLRKLEESSKLKAVANILFSTRSGIKEKSIKEIKKNIARYKR